MSTHQLKPTDHCDGATIQIHHRVRPGAADRYETWLRQIIEAAGRFPGHQGVHILRPPEGHHDYEIAVRFASDDDARRWRESAERRELMATIQGDLQQAERVEIVSGIDYWFTPPTPASRQPTRWKQWLVTTSVIWPLTIIVPLLWQPLFGLLPLLGTWGIRHGLIAATIVALVVYVVMPRVVKLVAPWLFR
ncbi:antibiotic biosynthesis monooxygenase [Halomonas daqingensis]|uniref:Antibiotic biosynthesis monooxygenase n=1 Tax=Billgrantia desiderata TaxID=52021 RepID=A0AAW4YS33_9GAMM|nr:antibiotic biosynthesis monooxygenase [Halomonas desiderata]MCE8010967.1 antibiotic biosynthesis monooxygenase [Halomonas desiderata]MCE8027637.1 antibiotic biosynthesis monooxygenase [Halomonas desiderata]MCE8041252.1 antibiotic biosynthesis monooxygenase [Halomonas desiderata]MCE8045827.1 antibiotic biosynthesis monooxygenase [Halomonas desiderata]MCE8051229.1 antibiotic biosynthesis monooxygenase [Halomonas desiderata]